MVIKLQVFW